MYQMEKHSDGLRPFLIGALLIGAMLLGCAQTPVIGAPVDHARLKDGTYEGSYPDSKTEHMRAATGAG